MKYTAKENRKRDRAFSQLILGKYNRTCRWCGKNTGKMDTAHIIPREYIPLRWDERNAVCLCFRCHKTKWHSNPLLAAEWIRSVLGDDHCNDLLITYKYDGAMKKIKKTPQAEIKAINDKLLRMGTNENK